MLPTRDPPLTDAVSSSGRTLATSLVIALLAIAWAGPCRAADTIADGTPAVVPIIPGVGSHDPRVPVPIAAAPWRAIGKLQATSGNLYESCTGTLIAPALVLTAAHCVFNPRTQHNFPPNSLHFLLEFDRGRYAGHGVGRRIEVGSGYDPHRPAATRGSDWAILALVKPLGTANRLLPILAELPQVGSRVMLGGYSQDRPLTLMADTNCRIVQRLEDAMGRPLLRDDCAGSSGVSGAPLLIERNGRWYVAAVAVAAEMGAASGMAALPDKALLEESSRSSSK